MKNLLGYTKSITIERLCKRRISLISRTYTVRICFVNLTSIFKQLFSSTMALLKQWSFSSHTFYEILYILGFRYMTPQARVHEADVR